MIGFVEGLRQIKYAMRQRVMNNELNYNELVIGTVYYIISDDYCVNRNARYTGSHSFLNVPMFLYEGLSNPIAPADVKVFPAEITHEEPVKIDASGTQISNNDGSNDGTTHYNLPPDATAIKHLIWHKNMNAQMGEIFRAAWRCGDATHSSKERDLRKIIAYAEQELERIERYEN